MRDGEQQRGVRAWRDRQPLVGTGGRRGAHRVDDNDLAALADASMMPITSGAASSEPCDAAGLAPITTSRSVRSMSGTGNDPPSAVHQVRRHVLRPLVDGAWRVGQRNARHAEQHPGVAAQREGVRERVAGVAGDRSDAVLVDHRRQQFGAPPERRVPGDLLPLPVHLDHRPADAVGVLVHASRASRPSGRCGRGSRCRRGCPGYRRPARSST